MSVIKDLAREHAAFTILIRRLETCASGDEKTAREDVRHTLVVLISAMDIHEEVEDAVFGHPSYASREDAKPIIRDIALQHQMIEGLRLEFLAAIASSGALPIQRLKSLVNRLATALRAHFKTEEERLWPHYERFCGSLDNAARRSIEEGIEVLESDIAANNAVLSRHLEAKR